MPQVPDPLRWIDAAELRSALPFPAAIGAVVAAFAAGAPAGTPMRSAVPAGDGQLLLMPAAGTGGVGVKLVTVHPDNPSRGLPLVQGVYVLFAADTLAPVALVDGAELTRLRTAAVSAVATQHLARRDARRLVVFGAGVQARAHVEAMRSVRPIDHVTIVGRDPGPAGELADELARDGLAAAVGGPERVADADIVCTCTAAAEPVFDGKLLAPGTHVNAIGAHQPHTRELDTETVARARVVVETRDAALAEAGDLLIPLAEGAITAAHVAADLAEVVRGEAARTGDHEITVFKSVGVAFEDLAVAMAAFERVVAR